MLPIAWILAALGILRFSFQDEHKEGRAQLKADAKDAVNKFREGWREAKEEQKHPKPRVPMSGAMKLFIASLLFLFFFVRPWIQCGNPVLIVLIPKFVLWVAVYSIYVQATGKKEWHKWFWQK